MSVDFSIKRLRPNAKFVMFSTNFVEWYDPDGLPPPTWEEVQEQMEKDKVLLDLLDKLE